MKRQFIAVIILLFMMFFCTILQPASLAAGEDRSRSGACIAQAGRYYTAMLKRDGTVWTWGRNVYGQLGNGTTKDSFTPVQVKSLKDVIAISAGEYHMVALKKDGTVWTWGSNTFGELGDGTTKNRSVPAQVKGLAGVITVSGGYGNNTVVLKKDGTVWTWGRNSAGGLGDGTTTERHRPVQVKGLNGVIAVSAGGDHAVALKKDGTVWSWGSNMFGQLGSGSEKVRHTTPVQAKNLSGVSFISAGSGFTMALKKDGSVWGWGYNHYGELGTGYRTQKDNPNVIYMNGAPSSTPVQVKGMTQVTMLSTGADHTITVKKDGTVWAWGDNFDGQLGNGSKGEGAHTLDPVTVRNIDGIVSVSAGVSHTVAVKQDGTIWAWGNNEFGQLGTGAKVLAIALQVKDLTDVSGIAAGDIQAVAFKKDQSTWGWGYKYGSAPIQDESMTGAIGATFNDATMMLKNDGTVWRKAIGEKEETRFTQVEGLTDVTAISQKGGSTLALKKDGTVWSYKDDSNWARDAVPVLEQVEGLSDVVQIASNAGPDAYYGAALKKDGTVWMWNDPWFSLEGYELNGDNHIPHPVKGLTGITGIAAGYSYMAAVKKDGTVWTWGQNTRGQLGNDTIEDQAKPGKVIGLKDVTTISAGELFMAALKKDGTVWAWGTNNNWELGDGTDNSCTVPVQVKGLSGIERISSGKSFSVALKKDGTVWTWGDNLHGQRGTEAEGSVSTPVQAMVKGN